MVTATRPPEAPPGGTPSAGQVAAHRWRASRGVLLALLALVVVAIGLAALRPSGTAQDQDPESPSPDGTRALAEILKQRGTPVHVSRRAEDAARNAGLGTVLVITRPERLTGADVQRLRAVRGDLLLVEPTRDVLEGLAPGVERAGSSFESIGTPDCALREATLAGRVLFDRSDTYALPPGGTGCYEADGLYRLVQTRTGDRTVTVLGSPEPLTNDMLDEEGNAALGMNLAGARTSVVWLIPDQPAPGSGSEEETVTDLLPFGVKLFILQLLIAVVLVALWRSRRLGPVVAETLPVVVRSAETVEGRARLYRAHRARGRAADALRSGARQRLVPLLGLPRSAAEDPASAREIVAAVAQRTGYDEAMVGVALYGPEPADDGQLVGLTDLLDDLERQVRHS
ncbi:DUF4350 domain-containing protein [Actinomadura rugatobispora]|uniref:DUF4350 domain-containing protein n=1 Tax=Actinomadura rugatobispora TaxID=1994 RepID=A0ABW1AEQ9_9ACTN|nr:DUF4350 domain-containing protein [Actinomadura rugatobispora]